MTLLITLTEEEKKIVSSYAKLHAVSEADAFKNALFEKIEDEYDLALFDEAYNDYVESGYESKPVCEFWSELENENL